MRHLTKAVLLAAIVLFPALAHAQSLTGVVRDGSGGVLPGVTVEAASPALIEKVRTVVSDGSGLYRLENLPPGSYSVTYTLPGFSTVKRDAVELTTGVTVTLNTDMRVGGLQETITVTGETPVVDVQNSTRVQRVLDDAVVAALPASRGYGNLLATVSGIQANGTANSGIAPDMIFFTSRGGRSNEGTVQIDGMNVGSAFNGGGVGGYGYDTPGAQEVQVTVAGGLGEADRGGPAFNLVPKTGGNNFAGTFFGNLAGKWSQSDNVDDELRSYGIPNAAAIIRSWDTSFSMGGPIKRDRVWFYGTARTFGVLHRHRRPLRQRQRRQSAAVGLRGRSEHHAALGHEPQDRRRPRDRPAHAAEQDQRLLRLSEGVRRQLVRRRRQSVPRPRRRLDRGGRLRQLVAGVDALARQLREDHAVRLHRAGDQQAADRSGVLAVLQQLGRPDADRRAGCAAVHPGGAADRRLGHGHPGGQHAVPRLRRPGQQPPDAQRVACVGLVRDRRAQHEGGLRRPGTR